MKKRKLRELDLPVGEEREGLLRRRAVKTITRRIYMPMVSMFKRHQNVSDSSSLEEVDKALDAELVDQ